MEEKQVDEGQEKMPSKSNPMIWIAVAVVVVIIGIVYFSRGGYRTASPASAPSSTPSSSGTTQNTGAAQNNNQTSSTAVTIQNFAFSPASLKIKKGDTVTWTNEDSAPHQIASDNNVFSGNSIGKGQTYSFKFSETGTFAYHCAIHPSMKGTVVVE